MEKGHQERLGGLVQEVMAEAGVGFDKIERIVVATGPGSFTGLRVGLSFAKGLGLALGAPVVGVGALEALAVSADGNGVTIAAVDAKRGQVWMQAFRSGSAITPPEAPNWNDAPVRAAALAQREAVTVVGSAAQWVVSGLVGATAVALEAPDVVALAQLGAGRDPADSLATPVYLRAPDATPKAA